MKKLLVYLASLFFLLSLSCSSDPDSNLREKFKAVGTGMDREKIITILGEPDKEINKMTGNLLIWNNEDGKEKVEIKIILDKVVYYKWKE